MKVSVTVSGVGDCETVKLKRTAVDTPAGRGVGAGSTIETSEDVELDDRVASMGVLELFIIEMDIVPESPAKRETLQVKEKLVVVHTPVLEGLIAADVTVKGSATLRLEVPTMGEKASTNIGTSVSVIPIPMMLSFFFVV